MACLTQEVKIMLQKVERDGGGEEKAWFWFLCLHR